MMDAGRDDRAAQLLIVGLLDFRRRLIMAFVAALALIAFNLLLLGAQTVLLLRLVEMLP